MSEWNFHQQGKSHISFSDGYPYHLQPFSNCSWKINTDDDTYLKVYVHDIGFCSNTHGAGGCPETTCLQIDQNIRLCNGTQNFKKEYLLKQNSTVIMLNTSREIVGHGFNLSIKAVGKKWKISTRHFTFPYSDTYSIDIPSIKFVCKMRC